MRATIPLFVKLDTGAWFPNRDAIPLQTRLSNVMGYFTHQWDHMYDAKDDRQIMTYHICLVQGVRRVYPK